METTPDSLTICNSLMGANTQAAIVRAAYFAHAGNHMNAEKLREAHGYSRFDLKRTLKDKLA